MRRNRGYSRYARMSDLPGTPTEPLTPSTGGTPRGTLPDQGASSVSRPSIAPQSVVPPTSQGPGEPAASGSGISTIPGYPAPSQPTAIRTGPLPLSGSFAHQQDTAAPALPPDVPSDQPPMEPMVIATPPPPSGSKPGTYILILVLFILGAVLGYVLHQFLPGSEKTPPPPVAPKAALTLPPDAVQIQACSSNRGTLYVKPQDIPVGPVYMVHKGKIVGIEFMLSQEDFVQGKDYKHLSGLGVDIDHVNVGLFSHGHEGYTSPHYHVDLYTITKEEEAQIICPQSPTPSVEASESATLKPDAGGSPEASAEGKTSIEATTATPSSSAKKPSPTKRSSPTPR